MSNWHVEDLPPFLARHITVVGACWIWTAAHNRGGYGVTSVRRKNQLAHRVTYTYLVGPIPDGRQIDHVRSRGCTNTTCVNPSHLEAVEPKVNVARSNGVSAQNARKTHCIRGHPFIPENTVYHQRPDCVERICRECRRLRNSKHYRDAIREQSYPETLQQQEA